MTRRIDEERIAVAGVYAEALLGLAERAGRSERVLEELQGLAAELERDADFERYLASPLVDGQTRRASLEKIFRGRLDDLLVDTLQVMNRKGRLELLRALAEAYRRGFEKLRGRVDVEVKTAVPLDDALRTRIRRTASRLSGREARLVETVDERIIGGLVVKIGDRKIDSSVARELEKVSQRLHDRASHEIHGGRELVE